jgi:phage recombination protein Bet
MNDEKQVAVVTETLLTEYLDSFGISNNLNEKQKNQFLQIAEALQLNPFKREIYCIPYYNKKTGKTTVSIITGYEVYLKRAERTGKLNGWNVDMSGKRADGTFKATITIHRKDWDQPLVHDVYFVEYNQNTHIWKSKPITMLRKVAIAQGFRLAFPDELGGMPYTPDELPDEMTRNVTPKKNDLQSQMQSELKEYKQEAAEFLKSVSRTKEDHEKLIDILDSLDTQDAVDMFIKKVADDASTPANNAPTGNINYSEYEVIGSDIPQDYRDRKSEYRSAGYGCKKQGDKWVWVRFAGAGKQPESNIPESPSHEDEALLDEKVSW